MLDHIVLSIELGVDVIEADALVSAALDRYRADRPEDTPTGHIEAFEGRIRSDPATALHVLLEPRLVVENIPGVRFQGSTGTQRMSDPEELLPWRRAAN